jgi:hypothetical protein
MRALATTVGVTLAFGWSLSCSSSTQTVTGPSTPKCQVTAAAEPATFAAAGGAGSLTVNTTRDCLWNATASGAWIQLAAESSGQGNATIAFNVSANPDPSQRRGAITIGDQQVTIGQEAAPCTFTVSPLIDSVSSNGERRTINVEANGPQCSWSARSHTEWLAIVQGSDGSGTGQVVYEAGRTTGPSRRGELTIAGHRVTVTQGEGCALSIAPGSQTVSAGGGSGAIGVTTAAGCPWSAHSESAWIAITSATSGAGPATVTFSVGAWDGPRRTGTLRIGQHAVTVTQNSGCRFGVTPESFSVTSAGGSATVAVTTAAGCEWTASSSSPWITVTAGGIRSGNGTVPFTVAPTTGPARVGTLAIAGRPFAVSQSSGCTFSINPAAHTFPGGGGPGAVAVSTGDGCPWTATTSVPWVRITSAGGPGPGTLTFVVDPTPSSRPRSTTLNIAGHTFALNQEGASCYFILSPATAALAAGGGAGSFEVNTPEGCPWTAVSNDGWLHVTAGASGSGDGSVSFSADANPGPARTGTIVAGGRLFTVSQAGAGTLQR